MPSKPSVFRPRYAKDPVQAERERKARLDRKRGSREARGYDPKWRAFRAKVIAEQGFCVDCGSTDKLHLDHIQSIKEAPERRFDLTNLRVLCHSCHSSRTARDQGFGAFNRGRGGSNTGR